MLSKFGLWLKAKVPFLFEDKMPVWLSILASILAFVAAYYIAPSINRQFQLDDARSAHLSSTLEGLNTEMIELSQKVRRLNSALRNEPSAAPQLREEALDLVTKLQWRLVDLRVVLKSPKDRDAVQKLSDALAGVKAALDTAVDADAEPRLLAAMRQLAIQARDVLDRLYAAARLK